MSGDPRSAASARAPRASVPPTRSRPGASRLVPGLIILGAGGACLLAGLDAVLLRPGARAPVDDAELVAFHGPLVLVGLLGTVVALERAMAARADWALLAPAGSATGWLALVAGVPGPAGRVLALLGALVLCAVHVRLHRRSASVAVDLGAMGAVALTAGDLLWLRGLAIEICVPLWLLLPLLTIVGERLELARAALPGTIVEETVRTVSAAALLGACVLSAAGAARLVMGPAMLALAAVMARYDIARRTIRVAGAVRLTAACALTGYLWLAAAGLLWTLGPPGAGSVESAAVPAAGYGGQGHDPAHPADHPADGDVVVQVVAVACASSMVLAHAPRIVSAVTHRRLRYHRAMWLPFVLLHAGSTALIVFRARAAVAAWRQDAPGAAGVIGAAGIAGIAGAVAALVLLLPAATRPAVAGSSDADRPEASGPRSIAAGPARRA